jgi:hypothetical protein
VAIGNAENSVDSADRASDAGAHSATNGSADRTRNAAAFILTLLRAADDALRMRQRRDGEQRQPKCQCRKPTHSWHFERVRYSPGRLYLIHHSHSSSREWIYNARMTRGFRVHRRMTYRHKDEWHIAATFCLGFCR